MSNSTTQLDLLSFSISQKEPVANALFDASSPAMAYGRRASTSGGLAWGYYGGTALVSGTPTQIANGTITLTASAINYIYVNSSGVVVKTTSPPASWPGPLASGAFALYEITVGASAPTSYIDYRTMGTGISTVPPAASITYAQIQNVSATDKLLGRSSAGAGPVEEITCTAAGRALIDDADAAAQRTTLGLGTAATLASDTDTSLTANSDTKLATQKAVKTYVDSLVTSGATDVMIFKGVLNCSANPNYPAADAGNLYKVSVAGKIGGASGVNVEAGDTVYCIADATAAGTQAAVGASWVISQVNIDGAVVGPASATDSHVAMFDGTTGKLIKDSGLTLSGVNTGDQDIHAATAKTTPVDADEMPITDSAASWVMKKLTLTNLKSFLKTYFDTLYTAAGAGSTSIAGTNGATGGDATATGGTSTTSASTGGNVVITGGTPGATGVGGAVTITAAAGGSTSGDGGSVTVKGGATSAGVAGSANLVGGANVSAGTGGSANVTGGGGGTTTAGGDANITSGAGSNSSGWVNVKTAGGMALTGNIYASTGVPSAGGTSGLVSLTTANVTGNGSSGDVTISSGTTAGAGHAGNISLTAGNNTSTSGTAFNIAGAAVNITAGKGGYSTGVGGAVTITGGVGNGAGAGGNVVLKPGASGTGAAGNVVMGTGAVLATGANGGFAYIPTCAGTPTGTPASVTGGVAMVYDTTNSKLYAYVGGAWVASANSAQPFDMTAFYAGVPTASAKVIRVPVARAITFPANFAGSYGNAAVAATASTAFDVQKNGTSVGTITFAATANSSTFTSSGGTAVTFAAGDILSIIAPATPDATLADAGFVLAGTR